MSAEVNSFLVVLMGLVGTPAVIAFIAWGCKEVIRSYLTVDEQKTINAHRQELDAHTEALKHSLQREMVRVEAYTKNKFSVYPILYEKLLKAEGGVTSLYGPGSIRFSTKQANFTESDVHSAMKERNIVGGEIEHVLKEFRSNRELGLEAFNKIMREVEFVESRIQYREAKNYFVLNELFVSEDVCTAVDKILTDMWRIWVDANVMHISNGRQDRMDQVNKGSDALRALMISLKDILKEGLEPGSSKS